MTYMREYNVHFEESSPNKQLSINIKGESETFNSEE